MAQLTLGLMTHTQHAHDGEEVRNESHTLEAERELINYKYNNACAGMAYKI